MKKTTISLCLIIFLMGCSEQEAPKKNPKPVSTITLSETQNFNKRIISGVVQPSDTTELSFEVSGKVEEVYFELGEAFKKGDKLAELEQTNYQLAVREREGQVSEARARLLETEQDFKRKRDLIKDGAVSKSQFDISKSQYESAKDQVEIAKARLGMAKENLKDTILIAPYAGTISDRSIEPSQSIRANMPAFTIQGDNGLEVSVLAPEAIVKSLSIGKKAEINIPAINKNFNAEISEIGTAAEDANSFPIIIKIASDQDMQFLKTGMSAEAVFKLSKDMEFKDSFNVPVSAVMAGEGNSHFIYKIETQNKENESNHVLKHIAVNILEYYDQNAIIQGDLAEGERVVGAGLAFLQDGQAVSPIDGNIERYNP